MTKNLIWFRYQKNRIKKEKDEMMRENWSSKLGFTLASLGGALGLGAMWKLPYVMGQNGGGAFILLFIAFNFLVGLPLFIAELILGRQSQKSIVLSFTRFAKTNSHWSSVAWLTIFVVLLILSWYTVVAGWSICYILLSLTDAFLGLSKEEVSKSFDALRSSGELNLLFQTMFIGLNAVILAKGLNKGIEKWSKIMTTALFLLLFGLSIYSMQLEGFSKALNYILFPDFSLLSPMGVLQALGLALFTLNIGYGANITYGSYLKKDDNIPKTASIVVGANLVASILIAITIFPMIFSFGFLPEAGEGLIFKTLPYVFARLPGSLFLSVLFFVLLLFAALTSSIAMFEVVVATITDLSAIKRTKAVLISAVLVIILGLPTSFTGNYGIFPEWEKIFNDYFTETINIAIDWLLVIIALFTTVFIAYIMPKNELNDGYNIGLKPTVFYYVWLFLLKVIVPLSILLVLANRARLL